MIPTPPSPSDLPTGPERRPPIRGTSQLIFRDRPDELEASRQSVEDLRRRVAELETRVARVEGSAAED